MTEEKVIEQTEEVVPPLPTTAPPSDESMVEAKTEEEPKVEEVKVEEPPASIHDEPMKWLTQQIPPAVHKVNYLVLQWLQSIVEEDPEKRQPIPGKNEATTKNQFINFLKDGQLLASFANKLSPGAIETIHEGEALKSKENQKANAQGFIDWAKTILPEDQVMSTEDLQEKGKQGYSAIMNTIWKIATNAKEKFEKENINTEQVLESAGLAVKTSIIQTILNFFKRARPQTTQSAKQAAMEQEEKERAEKSKEIEEENKIAETTTSTPAVVPAN
ncbi:unnamed protein product, partial [Mesorhabditis belari]|uniref:Calponin-homology (CH) domain-containing protein n=1 Tax=Mesorhabditis belari TaxID=2138241 RepID=A0AAF3EDI9_9BILA